ncbi:hypothetical protein HF883_00945 [Cloacibacillus porcorum]|uniref:hypothetical protein n=2 Tax=Cloacibacillus porcorum TaxID=1197717 RepID=UPI001459D7F7|nr:hypothetical protein [Cloacibacillus porcorum]MDY5390558.1 hypothetical protein [Cloacibacillus porcorum]NMF16793.1 hypothetical protein [Cloacibacillus porcorum]
MFFAETEGELTLGSAAAFAAGSVWRGNRAKQSNTPSVSPQKRRRSTFLREEGFKKKPPFIIDRAKAKPLFIIQLSAKRWPLFCCARMFGTLFSLNAQKERDGVSRPPLSLNLPFGADFIRLFPASCRRERQQRQQC